MTSRPPTNQNATQEVCPKWRFFGTTGFLALPAWLSFQTSWNNLKYLLTDNKWTIFNSDQMFWWRKAIFEVKNCWFSNWWSKDVQKMVNRRERANEELRKSTSMPWEPSQQRGANAVRSRLVEIMNALYHSWTSIRTLRLMIMASQLENHSINLLPRHRSISRINSERIMSGWTDVILTKIWGWQGS